MEADDHMEYMITPLFSTHETTVVLIFGCGGFTLWMRHLQISIGIVVGGGILCCQRHITTIVHSFLGAHKFGNGMIKYAHSEVFTQSLIGVIVLATPFVPLDGKLSIHNYFLILLHASLSPSQSMIYVGGGGSPNCNLLIQ